MPSSGNDSVLAIEYEKQSFQKKQLKLTVIIIVLWTIVEGITMLKNIFIYNLLAEPIDYASHLTKRAIPWATAIAFIFIINYSSKYLIKARIPLLKLPLIHFVLASIISITIYLTSYYALSVMGTTAFESSTVLKYFMVEIDRLFLVYLLISLTTTAHHYFHEIRTRELALQHMDKAYRESRILSLNNEVNPHMLFNILNNVYTSIDEDREQAKQMVLDFSDLLRGNLRNHGQVFIRMEDEEKFLKNYLNLQNGSGNRYQIEFESSDEIKKALIPKMILQPLVENAIKYGRMDGDQKQTMVINCSKIGDRLRIKVSNAVSPTHKKMKEQTTGLGIKNIKNRLQVLYPNDHGFHISQTRDMYSCSLDLPYRNGS